MANFATNGREIKKAKTDCGKFHFIDALKVDYKVGSDINILN